MVPIFKPGDRETLEGYMGMAGAAHLPLPPAFTSSVTIAGITFTFYDDAEGALAETAEFPKADFAAYANSVTLAKMLLLVEDPVDGETIGENQISALFSGMLSVAYDFSLLNLNGAHGGNVLTATLPGVPGTEGRPWLLTIDADQVWRADSQTTTTALFRVSTENEGTPSPAVWETAITPGEYRVYATWLTNVTQTTDNLDDATYPDQFLSPASNARYTIKDGGVALGTQPEAVDQGRFAGDPAFTFVEEDGLAFRLLGTFMFSSSALRVELSNIASGNVIAGPIRIEPVSGGAGRRIQNARDPETLVPEPGNEYTDNPATWTDLVYPGGGGNNPLWESEVLRPVFRDLFTDWLNGSLQFPALGDAASPDPNTSTIAKSELGSHATPFGPVVPDNDLVVPIPDALRDAILDGVNEVYSLAVSIESAPPFSVTLPVIDKTLAEIIGLSDGVDTNLRQPIVNYFATDSTPTVNEFIDLLRDLLPERAAVSAALEFELDLHKMISLEDIAIELGAAAGDVGLGLDGTLDLSAAIGFVEALDETLPKFTLGIDLTPEGSIALADRFYLRVERAVISADVDATGLNFGANFGFLGVGVVGGSLNLEADVSIDFNDPNVDGKITLDEFLATPLGTLVTVNASGSLTGSLPIQVDVGLGGFIDPNIGTVLISAPDLFDLGTFDVSFDGDFSNAFEFGDLSAEDVLAMVTQLTTQLDELRATDAVQVLLDLPVIGAAIDEILNFTDFAADTLLIDDLDDSDPGNDIPKLVFGDGTLTFTTAQEFAERLAIILGLDPSVIGAAYDPVTKLLTFNLSLHEAFSAAAPLDLGIDLAEGLADFEASVDAAIDATLDFGLVFGVDLNFDPLTDTLFDFVFIDDASLEAGLSLTAVDLDARARFGFVDIEIVDGSATAVASLSVTVDDPGTNAATASTGRIDLSELADALAAVSLDLTGSANITLPIAVPFLLIDAAPDTTMTLNWADLSDPDTISISDFPPGLLNFLPDFTNMDAGTLVSLLGQIANWLEDLRHDFSATDVPLVGDALDEVLRFADLFQNTLLFDDGGDGVDGATTLVADVNSALADAGLQDRIIAEAVDGRLHLFAIDRSITEISLTATGGNALGFGASQSSVDNLGRVELVAASAAPASGQLGGDEVFSLVITALVQGAPVTGAPVVVTVTSSSTTGNTSVGNDRRKLLDGANRPTFSTVDGMVEELIYILGLDIVDYDSVTKELTLDLNLGNPASVDNFGVLDVPLSFDLLNFETAGLLNLSSDSNIRLSAGGGLELTIGVYLGDEGGITLDDGTLLADLKDGIAFSQLQSISAENDVDVLQGQLTGDASFTLSVNDAASVPVTVSQFSGAPGTDINLTHHVDGQHETAIAVNPTNPNNIIVGVNDIDATDGIFGNTISRDHVYVTTNGGVNWTRVEIPLPSGAVGGSGDPTVVFDRTGRAVFSHLVDTDFGPNGTHEHGTGADDQDHILATAVSIDGGLTWINATAVTAVDADSFTDDKEFLGVGPDALDPTRDRFVLVFHERNVIYATTSLDGVAWSAPVAVSNVTSGSSTDLPAGDFAIDSIPAIGPNGEIYVVWENVAVQNQSKIMFDVSFDGGVTWGGGHDTQVLFATAESALTADDRVTLDAFAALLNADPTLVVSIAGHTDTAGSAAANQTLSDARAQSVFDYLTGAASGSPHAILASRLTMVGFGESQLVVATADGVDNAANRRVELHVDRLVYTGTVNFFNDTTSGGTYTVPAQASRGIWMGLSMDVDRSGGDHDGHIYVAFADQGDLDNDATTAHDDTDIFVIASVDFGRNWNTLGTAPKLVNFDDTTSNSQFFSWLDVDQSSGNVAVSWYDARNDDGPLGIGDIDGIANNDVMYYASYSSDGGLTWAPNIQVSDAASSGVNNGGSDYGDYTALAFLNGVVHMVWADTSDSTIVEAPNPDGALSFADAYYDRIDLTNTSFEDLLADINFALASAGLSGDVEAVADGQRVALNALGGTTSIALGAETGDPAITQIGFRDGQTAALAYGQLSGDATFTLVVNGAAGVAVTIPQSRTDGSAPGTFANSTILHLAEDINAALATAGLGSQIQAIRDDVRIALVGLEGVTSFSLTAAGGNAAVTEIGFGTSQTATSVGGVKRLTATNPVDSTLRLKAAAPVAGYVGRLTGDAVFSVSLSTVGGGAPQAVTVSKGDTDSNRSILDVVVDVQNALDDAGFEDKIRVGSAGNRLTFATLEPAATGFAISATAGSVAVNELGLPESASGSGADLLITTRNGTVHEITLDGATDLGDVITAIQTQTSGDVTVDYVDDSTRLRLTDHTTGSSNFKVANAPGSKARDESVLGDINGDGDTSDVFYGPNTAAFDLGIFGEIKPSATPGVSVNLNELIGAQLGGVDPLDRLFVRNAHAAASIQITTPQFDADGNVDDTDSDGFTDDGLNAGLSFGFVGLNAHGGGTMTGAISVGLKPADATEFDPDAKITLKDLIDNVSNLGDFLVGPDIDGSGNFDLAISMTPDIGIIGTTNPQLHIEITSLAEMLDGDDDGDAGFLVTTDGFDDLLNFENLGFGDILAALRALVDFLTQFEEFGFLNEEIPLIDISVNDMLSFVEDFDEALDELQANPAGTIQVLEDKLKEAFGLPAASDLLDLSLVDGHILRLDLNFSPSFDESIPLSLSLLPDGTLDLSGNANLRAQGGLDMQLGVGLDIGALTGAPLDIEDLIWIFEGTGITGSLDASADDIEFTAALGGLGAFIQEGSASITGDFNLNVAEAAMTAGTGDDERISLVDLLSNLESSVDFGFSGDIEALLPISFPTRSSFRGDIEVGGTLGFNLTDGFTTAGTAGPGNDQFIYVPDDILSIDFSQFSPMQNLLLIVDGIDGFLGLLEDAFDGEIGGLTLPLIGDQLVDAAEVIGDFRRDFVAGLRDMVETADSPTENYISVQLFSLLHTQLGILGDRNEDGFVTIEDIQLLTNVSDTDPVPAPEDIFMQWNLQLGGTLLDAGTGIDFDIGVPGLGLETRGAVQATLDWQLDFGFGVDLKEGFYLDIADVNELELNLDVTLPGAGLTGRLAFLQLDADDNGDTHLGVTLGVDIRNGRTPADTHLGFAQLGDISVDIGIAAEAIVDLGLELQLNSDLVPGADTVFPKIVGDFYLDWSIGNRSEGTLVGLGGLGNAIEAGLHLVEFRDIGLDLGTFISDFLSPIVQEVQKVTEPLQPVIDVITAPIPVISDLAGSPISLIDIAGMTGYVNADLIYAIADVISLVNSIPDPADVGSLIIPFGSFTVFDDASATAGFQPALWDPGFNPREEIDVAGRTPAFDFSSALSGIDTSGGGSQAETTKSFSNGFAGNDFGDFISFPIFQDPTQIFGLLMGDNPTLIAIDLPELSMEFSYSQFFTIFGPLGVSITGTIGMKIDFGPIGYDTLGLRQFFDSGFRNPELLFNGLYISDTAAVDGSGPDIAELVFTGGISAAAELNLGVAKAGVAGGIFIEIDFDLHDPDKDGKIRLEELAKNFLNQAVYAEGGAKLLAPLAIFDVHGEIFLKLFAFLKVDLFFFSIDEEFDITPPITLVEFDIPFTRVPTLASELPGGVLQLNMGSNAGLRLEGDISDGNETFVVAQHGTDLGKVDVTAYGYTQTYSASSKIIALGGEGNDIIDLSGITNSSLTYEIEGGAGNDQIILAASAGAALIRGGTGDDEIVSGAGADIIYGEAGNDDIDAGGGNDLVFGDDGKIGEDGLTLKSSTFGGGNDTIAGGAGDDLILGGGGNDAISGGGGNDIVIGDGALLTLAAPNSYLNVTTFENTSSSTGGIDVITGDDGNDIIYAGGGNDQVDGGAGNDTIWAEAGFDDVLGGSGDDTIHGGTNDDTIDAGDGNDTVWGDEGKDLIHGGGGIDTIRGGTGGDTLFGDADNDFIYGESDADKIYGGGGDDFIHGGVAGVSIHHRAD